MSDLLSLKCIHEHFEPAPFVPKGSLNLFLIAGKVIYMVNSYEYEDSKKQQRKGNSKESPEILLTHYQQLIIHIVGISLFFKAQMILLNFIFRFRKRTKKSDLILFYR